jgi:hypothetical protein
LRKLAILLLCSVSTVGCDSVSKIAALAACTNRAEMAFPDAKGLAKGDFPGDVEGFGEADSSGNFHYVVREKDRSIYFSCRGNIDRLEIDEVTFKNVTVRPTAAEQWNFK